MSATLENAPIVELIAELRWACSAAGALQGAPQSAPEIESFLEAFASAVAADGYVRSERLVPIGSPTFLHQSAYRIKRLDEDSATSLFQVGPGVFSANAVSPYESWDKFASVVELGVERLLATRAPSERESAISSINLRYIDLFDPRLTEGRSVDAFIREVLKIEISLPEALTMHSPAGAVTRPFLQFQIPMNGGFIMNFGVGEGVANGRQGVVMDMSVATTVETAASASAIMGAFWAAHEVIDASFRAFIEPIRHLMPKKEASV